ncbi:MAG: sulfite exporter TauE/SafE family protein [Ignavibacteriales bacterium]|nr:sulfite exporter TauE/SafE family protein [Ignavibacteriales bacterium]
MELFLALVSGLVLGCIHAFDADHVIAVSTFAAKLPEPRRAVKLGISWGLGHTATVFVLGLVSLAFRFAVSPLVESIAEIAVGLLLVAVGFWALAGVFHRRGLHIHKHVHDGLEHVHVHSHAHSEEHRHQHSMFFIGATHGFAGTAGVMVVIPIALTQSLVTAGFYLLLFCAGTIVAMSAFAYFVGAATQKLHSKNALTLVQGLAGLVSICIGLLWISQRIAKL